jgi:hypothetical protein
MLAVFALATPAIAQTKGQQIKPKVDTEKLWRIEASGISGWGAASMAQRVSSVLKKHKNIKKLVFDTTGVGYFELKNKKSTPEIADLNMWLEKKNVKRVKIKKLKEVDVETAAIVYECSISGLGWGATAVETRDVLSKLPGVIRVHPNGINGKALVFVKDKKAVTKEAIAEAMMGTKKLRLRKMKKAGA